MYIVVDLGRALSFAARQLHEKLGNAFLQTDSESDAPSDKMQTISHVGVFKDLVAGQGYRSMKWCLSEGERIEISL